MKPYLIVLFLSVFAQSALAADSSGFEEKAQKIQEKLSVCSHMIFPLSEDSQVLYACPVAEGLLAEVQSLAQERLLAGKPVKGGTLMYVYQLRKKLADECELFGRELASLYQLKDNPLGSIPNPTPFGGLNITANPVVFQICSSNTKLAAAIQALGN